MSSDYPFRVHTALALAALAAAVLLAPAVVRAETTQQAAVGDGAKAEAPKSQAGKSEAAKPAEAPTTGMGGNAAVQGNPAQKSIAARAVDKVKDIFARVPCLPPKGGYKSMGSLPHVASKLVAGQPVTIIAFGTSSTQGFGSTSREFTYPSWLAAQLRRHYTRPHITVLRRA